MSIKTRKAWLAIGATALLASGTPGFFAPGMMYTVQAQNQKITGTVVDDLGELAASISGTKKVRLSVCLLIRSSLRMWISKQRILLPLTFRI